MLTNMLKYIFDVIYYFINTSSVFIMSDPVDYFILIKKINERENVMFIKVSLSNIENDGSNIN